MRRRLAVDRYMINRDEIEHLTESESFSRVKWFRDNSYTVAAVRKIVGVQRHSR
jgi:hypothetical protein